VGNDAEPNGYDMVNSRADARACGPIQAESAWPGPRDDRGDDRR